MRVHGTIKSWNDDRGFGFIKPENPVVAGIKGKDVFLHIKALQSQKLRPQLNQQISFELERDRQGRLRAKNARIESVSPRRQRSGKPRISVPSIITTALFIFLGAATVLGKISIWIPFAYGLMSLLTFAIYALDKSSAQVGGWRTKEKTLHLLALIGGWPGALIAQQRLRHKSRKQSFLVSFWITVILNCVGLFWLFTAEGKQATDHMIHQIEIQLESQGLIH